MMSEPQTKLSKLVAAANAGDWAGALRIAAKFPELGEYKAVIHLAHQCAWNPAFYRQLGRDPETCIADGIAALKARYKL
jgi:hypothetical protein